MLANRVRMGNNKGKIEYIGEVYLAQDDDFVKVNNWWVYRGSELEIEIPYMIQGEEVTSYERMFYGSGSYLATPVTRVDSNNKRVTDMSNMFYNSKATTLDLSSFDTSKVTNMTNMFYGSSTATLDLSSFDTSQVTNMNGMFNGSKATTLDLSSFDTSNVTNTSNMFYSSKATTLDVSSFDTSKVTNMTSMFRNTSATTLDLSSFDTSKVPITSNMFNLAKATTGYARTQADANRFNASSNKPAGLTFIVKPPLATDDDFVSVYGFWVYRGAALEVEIPTHIYGELVTSAQRMFAGDSPWNAAPVTKVVLNHSNVTMMSYMFQGASATALDLSSFDTSNVTEMVGMFYNSYTTTLDLSSFDTSKVIDTEGMFQHSKATTGYARTQSDANRFNASPEKPTGLNFVVKP